MPQGLLLTVLEMQAPPRNAAPTVPFSEPPILRPTVYKERPQLSDGALNIHTERPAFNPCNLQLKMLRWKGM